MNKDEHHLVGIIYETALNPDIWPVVLEGLIAALDDAQGRASPRMLLNDALSRGDPVDAGTAGTNGEWLAPAGEDKAIEPARPGGHQLFERLKPHLRRALQLRLQQQRLELKCDSASRLLDRVPIGIVVADRTGRVLYANSAADDILEKEGPLQISGNYVHPFDERASRAFRQHLLDLCSDPGHDPVSMTLESMQNGQLTLLLTPFGHLDELFMTTTPAVMIFVTPPLQHRALDQALLQSAYGLTPSEALLASHLVQGKSLEDAARERAVSINTVRNQLAAIFAKTGTKRQSELVVRLLSQSLPHSPDTEPRLCVTDRRKMVRRAQMVDERQIRLADGRLLGYAEYGDRAGKPVIFCHSVYGCRFEAPANDRVLHDCRVRLIIPDRPGIGLSDPVRPSGYLGWATDLRQLAGFLGLDRFSVVGYGTGVNFALAAARQLPSAVEAVTAVSPTPPIETIEDAAQLIPAHKITMALMKMVPAFGVDVYHVIFKGAARNPERFFSEILPADELERELISRPEVRDVFHRSIAEIVKHGARGQAAEVRYCARPLPFDLAKIKQPVCFWRGELDRHVPKPIAEKFMAAIPHATVHRLADRGHALMYTNWNDIVRHLAGCSSSIAPRPSALPDCQ